MLFFTPQMVLYKLLFQTFPTIEGWGGAFEVFDNIERERARERDGETERRRNGEGDDKLYPFFNTTIKMPVFRVFSLFKII